MIFFLRFFLLLPFFLFSEELEIELSTRSPLTPVYVSNVHLPKEEPDWRYFDELRAIFVFDLNTNGFSTTLPTKIIFEETFHWPDVRAHFDPAIWKKEKIPYVFTFQMSQNRLQLTVFDVEKGSAKKYPEIALTRKIDEDRTPLHRLADLVQKDLFGMEGIASLKILYTQRKKSGDDWGSEIWIADSDGARAKKLLSEKGYCLSPGFFPPNIAKGDFFYVSFQDGQSKIYRSSLNKTAGEILISLRGSQALPAINREGSQIAFITDAAGRPDLFIQNLDAQGKMVGKARQLFSAPRATQASPTFSPDGKRLAFVSDKDGPPRVYIMEVTGPKSTKRANPRLLTKKNRENTSPTWSPDGKKLAYSAKVNGIRQIWIYNFETEEEFQITAGPQNKENPSWAPDSLHLVYNTESDDVCELYLIHLNQGDPVLISKGPGQKRFPCWETRAF